MYAFTLLGEYHLESEELDLGPGAATDFFYDHRQTNHLRSQRYKSSLQNEKSRSPTYLTGF